MIISAEDDPKAHVYDAQYHRHLHFIGVQEREPVGRQVPNLNKQRGRIRLPPGKEQQVESDRIDVQLFVVMRKLISIFYCFLELQYAQTHKYACECLHV